MESQFDRGCLLIKSEYLDPKMIEHVLYALTPQNRLICRVCLKTGLRLSDVLSLKTDSLSKRMTIRELKTGKKKTFTIGDRLFREMSAQAGQVYVFPHRTDPARHKTRQAVYADLKRASKAFRVKCNFSPHSLRKVYAVELYRKYGDLKRVQKALNHDNDVVTIIYALADELQRRK